MTFTRPLSLMSAVRIQLTTLTSSAPQKAGHQPATWKPLTKNETSFRQNAFSTSRKIPRVSRVIGKVSTTRMGPTPAFNESYYGYSTFSKLLEEAAKQKILTLERDAKSGTYIITSIEGDRAA